MYIFSFIVILLSLISCGPKPEAQSELNYNSLSWNFKKDGNREFSNSNQQLIQSSMNVLARRIDQANVWSCAKKNAKRWKVNNSGQDITTTERFRGFVHLHENAFRTGDIPGIDFVPFYENSEAHGRAYVGGFVKARFVETTSLVPIYKFDGRFQVMINLKHLNSRTWNKPDVWAGTIFHEMLHQMGYNHEKDNYTDDMFITVIGDCITTNGVYQSRNGASLTGGAWPIPD